jgi:hypothetical protein
MRRENVQTIWVFRTSFIFDVAIDVKDADGKLILKRGRKLRNGKRRE